MAVKNCETLVLRGLSFVNEAVSLKRNGRNPAVVTEAMSFQRLTSRSYPPAGYRPGLQCQAWPAQGLMRRGSCPGSLSRGPAMTGRLPVQLQVAKPVSSWLILAKGLAIPASTDPRNGRTVRGCSRIPGIHAMRQDTDGSSARFEPTGACRASTRGKR